MSGETITHIITGIIALIGAVSGLLSFRVSRAEAKKKDAEATEIIERVAGGMVQKAEARITDLEELTKRLNADLCSRDKRIQDLEKQVIYLNSVLINRDNRIQELERQVEERDDRIREMQAEIIDLTARLELVEKGKKRAPYEPKG